MLVLASCSTIFQTNTKERAFDKFFVPWLLVTMNTIMWTIIIHIYKDSFILRLEAVTSLYNLVLTTALAFLLVFRLNRVAIRWCVYILSDCLLYRNGVSSSIDTVVHFMYVPLMLFMIHFISILGGIPDQCGDQLLLMQES